MRRDKKDRKETWKEDAEAQMTDLASITTLSRTGPLPLLNPAGWIIISQGQTDQTINNLGTN